MTWCLIRDVHRSDKTTTLYLDNVDPAFQRQPCLSFSWAFIPASHASTLLSQKLPSHWGFFCQFFETSEICPGCPTSQPWPPQPPELFPPLWGNSEREDHVQSASGFAKQVAKNNLRKSDTLATVEEICQFQRGRMTSSIAFCILFVENSQQAAGWPPTLHLNTVAEKFAFHHHVAFFSSSHRPSLGLLQGFQACITSLHTCWGLFTFNVEQ